MRAVRGLATATGLAVVAVGAWALPAAADAPTYTVTVDCANPVTDEYQFVLPVGGSVALNATNCVVDDIDGLTVDGDLTAATLTLTTPGVAGYVDLYDGDGGEIIEIYVAGGAPVPDPTGTLGGTGAVIIPQESPSSMPSGEVYGTLDFSALEDGTYTLRVVDVDPTSYQVDGNQPWHPSADTYIYLYAGAFDPANPTANLIGYNDDGGLAGVSATGTLVARYFSQIVADLTAGTYTLVIGTYDGVTADEWSAGVEGEFDPATATISVEIWGPDGAIAVDAMVTSNPANVSVKTGTTATFEAAAVGGPLPTVQWQRSNDGGATWTNISGATSTTYAFTAVLADSGAQFRAVFTSGTTTAATTAATLAVTGQELAATGSSTLPGLMLAFVLIAAGAAFVVLSTRRRAAVTA